MIDDWCVYKFEVCSIVIKKYCLYYRCFYLFLSRAIWYSYFFKSNKFSKSNFLPYITSFVDLLLGVSFLISSWSVLTTNNFDWYKVQEKLIQVYKFSIDLELYMIIEYYSKISFIPLFNLPILSSLPYQSNIPYQIFIYRISLITAIFTFYHLTPIKV